MVPITRQASSPNKQCCIFLLIIMLASGIVQDMFAGEAGEGEGGEEETTGGYFSTATSTGTFTAQARNSFIS